MKYWLTVAIFAINGSKSMEAPCYGYGNLLGYPGDYLRDDYIRVTQNKVGQGDIYIGQINAQFKSRRHVQFLYSSESDSTVQIEGWAHGDQPENFKTSSFSVT